MSFLVSWSHELQRNIAGLRSQVTHLKRRGDPDVEIIQQTEQLIQIFDDLGLHTTTLASNVSEQLCCRIGSWKKEVSELEALGNDYSAAVMIIIILFKSAVDILPNSN